MADFSIDRNFCNVKDIDKLLGCLNWAHSFSAYVLNKLETCLHQLEMMDY